MKTIRTSLVLAVVAVIGCSAWGTTFYVPADGTLKQVVNRSDCVSGDTIVIEAGTYTGADYKDIRLGSKNLTVRSTDPDDPAIVAATVIDCQGSGQVFLFQGESTVAGLTIVNGRSMLGGAINLNNGASPTISRCVIRNCTGTTYGGAIYIANGSPTIERCKLTGNYAGSSGGAIFISGGSPVIKNCIISDNSAFQSGGAFFSYNAGSPVISQCTITNNFVSSSNGSGGAIRCYNGSNVAVLGSILWNNAAANAAQMLVGGTGAVATNVNLWYCNVQGLDRDIIVYAPSTLSRVGNIEADPMFVEGDWRLSEGSLCINAGDPAYAAAEGEKDFYGNARVWGGTVDIGAAEYFVEHAEEPEGVEVRLWPEVINLRGKQNFLFCTIRVEGRESDEIDAESILLEGTLKPIWSTKYREAGEVVLRFDMAAVALMVADGTADEVTLTITGAMLDGTSFDGSDTLKVYRQKQANAANNSKGK